MKKQHPMKREQVKKMVETAVRISLRDGCILMLASNHAMRSSELAALKTSDVNLKDRRIFIVRKKGSKSESDPLLPTEVELLEKYLLEKPEHALLFPSSKPSKSRQQGELSNVQIYRIFRYYAELSMTPDVSRAPHAFRHSLAQHHADHGTDIKTLQRIMGHKDINSTSQYYDKTREEIDEAILTVLQ